MSRGCLPIDRCVWRATPQSSARGSETHRSSFQEMGASSCVQPGERAYSQTPSSSRLSEGHPISDILIVVFSKQVFHIDTAGSSSEFKLLSQVFCCAVHLICQACSLPR